VHPFALKAFSAGDFEPLARWDDGAQEWVWADDGAVVGGQTGDQQSPVTMPADASQWPRVEIVHSHAGASGDALRVLLHSSNPQASVRGVVVSSTGNGSIHHSIGQALRDAVGSGRLRREDVLVATRCTQGWVVGDPDHGWPVAHTLTPAQARVHLMLEIVRRAAPAQ
jgi:L-asparaginase